MQYSLNNSTVEDFKKFIDEQCRWDTDRLLNIKLAVDNWADVDYVEVNTMDIYLSKWSLIIEVN